MLEWTLSSTVGGDVLSATCPLLWHYDEQFHLLYTHVLHLCIPMTSSNQCVCTLLFASSRLSLLHEAVHSGPYDSVLCTYDTSVFVVGWLFLFCMIFYFMRAPQFVHPSWSLQSSVKEDCGDCMHLCTGVLYEFTFHNHLSTSFTA